MWFCVDGKCNAHDEYNVWLAVAGAAFVIAFIITDDELRFFLALPISPVYYCLCSAVDVLCDWVLFAIVDLFSSYFFLIFFTIKSIIFHTQNEELHTNKK